ncbi:MAG: hypothetical protein AAB789_00800, partial [Patescibacteria group bacterium]
YPDFKKWLSQKKFSQWLDSYAKFNGLQMKVGKSQEGRWFELIRDGYEQPVIKNHYEVEKTEQAGADELPF